MRTPDTSNPLVIAALGVAIAAVLWGAAQLIAPIFDGVAVLIKAIGAAGGIAVATATTGFASAGAVAPWLAPAAAGGLAAAGAGATYIVLHKVVEKGKEQPYEWLLPALGLLAVFFVDLTKDELFPTFIERAIYALTTGLCTIGGGILLLNQRIAVRVLGAVLPFAPTVVVWAILVREQQLAKGLADFVKAGSVGAIGLVGVFVLALVIVGLGIFLPKRNAA
jgi:hypothetical protein